MYSSCVDFSVLPKSTQTCSPDLHILITLYPQALLSCLLMWILPPRTLFICVNTIHPFEDPDPGHIPHKASLGHPSRAMLPHENKTSGTQRHVSF